MATLQEAMTIARYVTNDAEATSYARQDPVLLQFANDALDAIAESPKSGLFHAVIEVACVANTTMQTFNITDSLGLVDILHVKNGKAVTPCDSKTLDLFVDGWNTMTPATAEHWMPVAGDPFRFKIYPPAPSGQILIGTHIEKPLEYTATQTHRLPNSYTKIIGHYIVAQLDSMEDEHAVSGRAKLYFDMFNAALSA